MIRAESEMSTLWAVVERAAQRRPDAVMAQDEHGRQLTFAGFRDAADETAAWLAGQGIGEDSIVCWQLPTQLRTLSVMVALSRLRATQIPLIPQYREREIGFITEQTRADAMLVPGTWNGTDYAALSRRSARPGTRVTEIPAEPAGPARTADPRTDDPDRWIFYTSGTTGAPRGAVHETTNFIAAAQCWVERVGVRPTDCLTVNFPVAHVGGICYLLVSLLSGCSVAVTESFNSHVLDFYETAGVTLAAAGTVFHQAYLKAQRQNPDRRILPKVRAFVGGGAPKPPALHYAMKDAFDGVGVVSGYGMTEGMMLSMNRVGDQDDKLARSEGMPGLGVDLRIVADDESLCAPGETGEIRVKSPTLFSGYFDGTLNKGAFDEFGYLHTGDLGYLDDDGYLIISGRLKDVILRKAETLDAKEIEDVLAAHTAVAEAAVVGLPDDERGELVCAVLVLREPASEAGTRAVVDDVVQHLKRSGLMKQKFPERWEFCDELPRNPTGKVLKQELRRRYVTPDPAAKSR